MSFLFDLYCRAVQLCLFKITPMEMPVGRVVMLWSMTIYFFVAFFAGLLDMDWLGAGAVAGGEAIAFCSLTAGLLYLRGQRARITQTLTAMMSTGAVIGLFFIPLSFLLPDDLIKEQIAISAGLLLLVFMLWNLMVIAHVLRHTMEIKPAIAAIISVGVLIVVALVSALLLVATGTI